MKKWDDEREERRAEQKERDRKWQAEEMRKEAEIEERRAELEERNRKWEAEREDRSLVMRCGHLLYT